MRKIRLYVDEGLSVGADVVLEGQVLRYVDKVLRLKKGAEVVLFNGNGFDYVGVLEAVSRAQAVVRIGAQVALENELAVPVVLYAALLKGDTMDRVVQKAVELGVCRLVPVMASRCEVVLKGARLDSKLAHWQGVAVASAQQCGRARLMAITPPVEFSQGVEMASGLRWIFSPYEADEALDEGVMVEEMSLMVGAEGGWTPEEVAFARDRGWRAQKLGKRILRADTASVAAVLRAQFVLGEEGW